MHSFVRFYNLSKLFADKRSARCHNRKTMSSIFFIYMACFHKRIHIHHTIFLCTGMMMA